MQRNSDVISQVLVYALFSPKCTSFKPLCIKKYVDQWLRKLLLRFLPTIFSVALPFYHKPATIRNFLKTSIFFPRFVMAPRPLAPTRPMRSRTCADVIQPCCLKCCYHFHICKLDPSLHRNNRTRYSQKTEAKEGT